MRPQRKRFETTAVTRRGLNAAPREALVLCRVWFATRGTAANDNSFSQSVANDNRTEANRRSRSAAPLVVVRCRESKPRGTECLVSTLPRVKAWAPAFAGVPQGGTYNAAGQLIYATNPLGQTRFWEYDASGRMTRATVPVAVAYASVVYGTTNVSAATAASYNYTTPCSGVTAPANTNLPISVTDSQGYVLCYQYDALDRVTKVKYPDGTTEQYDYNFPTGWTANGVNYGGTQSLDVWQMTDRQGRVTSYTYDRNRRMTAKTEPVTVAGVATTRTTSYSYYADGTLKELTDANGNVTHWDIDIQSRPTAKTYAYGTAAAKTETYTYDLAGRLKTVTDAKAQVLTLVRNKDNSVASYAYTNAVIATPGASFTYDPWYPRRTGMTDQFGSTSWTYKAVGTNGALATDTEDGPFGNDSLTLAYDAAGRVNSRTVSGTTAETFGFDTLGRMNSHVTQLGSFTYGYLGNSGQVSTRSIGGITTTWGYDTNANDRRLLTISTTGAVARNFTYASNAYQITGITDTPAATHPWLGQSWSFSYDGSDRLLTGNGTIAGNSSFSYDKLDNATSFAGATASYNGLNQITAWNSSTHTYDNNGNLTGDGTRTYTYDAADRLKTVTQGGTTTTFAYDGLGRRLKQTVGTTETRYLWCGAAICQQRSNTDTIQKRFFAEGEYVLTGTKKYLTLTDHLGSVRDLVDITGTPTLVGSFDYTPYGATARSWGTVTPGYTYAGLFAHPQTGLLLSATRAYEPGKGRWLNRDSISGWDYIYNTVNPVMNVDPEGFAGIPIFTMALFSNPRFSSVPGMTPIPQSGAGSSIVQNCLFKGGSNGGGGGEMDACMHATYVCHENAGRLYDKGYEWESRQLIEGCGNALAECRKNEALSEGLPFFSFDTYFPPNKGENGGGYVNSSGGHSVYIPPSTDPIAELPPKKRPK